MSADASERFSEIQREIYRHGYDRGYEQSKSDVIDEFVKECVEFENLTFAREHIQRIKMIAEQLKEKKEW